MKLAILILCTSLVLVVNAQFNNNRRGGKAKQNKEENVRMEETVMVGGFKDLNVDDENIRPVLDELAGFSLNKVSEKRRAELGTEEEGAFSSDRFNYSLIEVVSAQSQVVAGINYNIRIRMKERGCKRGCDVEMCDLQVYERKWDDFRELSNFNCTLTKRKQQLLGAKVEIPVTNEQALQAVDFSLARLNQESNDLFKSKLIKLNKAMRQVVAGVKYVLEFTISPTTCTKNDVEQLDLKTCPVQKNAKQKNCVVEVWDQSWMDRRYKMLNSNCTLAV